MVKGRGRAETCRYGFKFLEYAAMAVWKRYKGRRVKRGHKDYDKATWIAAGKVDGVPYKKALPKETIKTAEQARAEDDRIRTGVRTGEPIHSKARFSEYVDNEFLPYWQTNFLTYPGKVSQCKTLKIFFKNESLKAITPSRCEALKRWLLKREKDCQKCRNNRPHECTPQSIKNATVNRFLSTLRTIFDRARADRKIIENPMDFVPALKEDSRRERYLTIDERERLLNSLPTKLQPYAVIITAFLTGWRRGQILSLKVSSLMPGGMVWRPAQKGQPKRLVPVHPLVYRILTSLAEIREDWLFINPAGKKLVSFDPVWRDVLKTAGITDFRFHDLRHNMATELLDGGTAEFAIQHALGHARVQTTQGYTHVKNEYLAHALGRLKVDDIPILEAISMPSDAIM